MRYEIKGGSFPVVICNLENGEKMITEKPNCILSKKTGINSVEAIAGG